MFHSFASTEPKRKADAAAGGAAPAKQAKTLLDEKLSEIEHHLETIRIFICKISKKKDDETLEKLSALEYELEHIFEGIHFNPRYPNCAGCNRPGPLGPAPGQTAHMGPGGCLACDDSSSDDSSSGGCLACDDSSSDDSSSDDD